MSNPNLSTADLDALLHTHTGTGSISPNVLGYVLGRLAGAAKTLNWDQVERIRKLSSPTEAMYTAAGRVEPEAIVAAWIAEQS